MRNLSRNSDPKQFQKVMCLPFCALKLLMLITTRLFYGHLWTDWIANFKCVTPSNYIKSFTEIN